MSDLIDRLAAIAVINGVLPVDPMKSEYAQGIACGAALAKTYVEQLPSAQPYTDEEIQKMQDIEQAQLDKIRELAYQEGKADAMAEIIRCRECVWHDGNVCRNNESIPWSDDDFCSCAERREVSETDG